MMNTECDNYTIDNTNNTKNKNNIPKLKPETYPSRSDVTPISKDEWEDENEIEISRLWVSMNNYLEFNNVDMLDKCTYTDFCTFVALYTTPRLKYNDS